MYKAIWKKIVSLVPRLQDSLETVMCDYEKAVMEGVQAQFLTVTIHGCWFHFNQETEEVKITKCTKRNSLNDYDNAFSSTGHVSRSVTSHAVSCRSFMWHFPECAPVYAVSTQCVATYFFEGQRIRVSPRMGCVNRCEVWVPHLLTEANLMNHTSMCDLLRQIHEKDPFLKRPNLDLYENVHRKRTLCKDNKPSTVAKAGLHPKKVLISIWWDWKDVIFYEVLPQDNLSKLITDETIN
ncbi:uncharacterized protein LOC105663680 [Megachile rotundata]|uniref:uncharacterized protein LOC105663680 n=1 Tax=Megachile rotundata TaxID=143995 RepID=UPI003FD59F03